MSTLTVATTSNGPAVADALSGGGVGWDISAVVNGGYTGVLDKASNTGSNDLYLRHDSIDPLTNLAVYAEQFSQSYGGFDTAAADFARLQTLAEATSGTKNNADGLTEGWWLDMDYDASVPNQFDYVNFGPVADTLVTGGGSDVVRILRRFNTGNITDEGSSLATRITVPAAAMFLDPLTAPGAPVDGTIGIEDDATLGDRCLIKHRFFLKSAETVGGILQFDETFSFVFTA